MFCKGKECPGKLTFKVEVLLEFREDQPTNDGCVLFYCVTLHIMSTMRKNKAKLTLMWKSALIGKKDEVGTQISFISFTSSHVYSHVKRSHRKEVM